MTAALFVVAAAAAAIVRYVAADRLNQEYPIGSFLLTVAACFGAGALSQLDPPWPTVAVVGGAGTLASWAETANDVALLARAGQGRLAWLHLLATLSTGILAAWLGLQLAGGAVS